MKISDIRVLSFRTHADRWDIGHAEPIPRAELMQTVTCIDTDEGVTGYFFGGGLHGDQEGLNASDREAITGRIRDLLVGQDPVRPGAVLEVAVGRQRAGDRRERRRQRAVGPCRARTRAAGLQAVGRGARPGQGVRLDLPQHRQAPRLRRARAAVQGGGLPSPTRSTRTTSGIRTPASLRPGGRRTSARTSRPATWCARAVGPDMVLMFDPWGTYMTMEEAVKVGRELEKLDFSWFEHPMPEYPGRELRPGSAASCPFPSSRPRSPPAGCSPAPSGSFAGAGDMSRIDVLRGGVTGARKTAVGVRGVRAAVRDPHGRLRQPPGLRPPPPEDTSEYYEKGLLAPCVDYDAPAPLPRAHLRRARRRGLRRPACSARPGATRSCGTTSRTTSSRTIPRATRGSGAGE